MAADMFLDHLCHEAVHGSADRGEHLQDIGAADLGFKGAFDGFDLPTNAPHPRQQLGFLANGMGHSHVADFNIVGYGIMGVEGYKAIEDRMQMPGTVDGSPPWSI